MDSITNGAAAPLDFGSIAPEDVAVLEITTAGRTDDERIPTGWKITFAGPAHPKTVAYNDERGRIALREAQAIEAQQRNGRKVKPDDTPLEDQRRNGVRWILARVVDWTPVLAPWIHPDPIKPSDTEIATRFLMDPKTTFAFAQMVEFLTAEKSFTKRSATT
jgi:hypothetical protein